MSPAPADLPQAPITNTSLTARHTILPTPLAPSAPACSMKPGRCFALQVGVNAPGTENSTTRPLPRSSAASTFVGPSAPITFNLPSGILSPALMVMLIFLPCLPLTCGAPRAGKLAGLDQHARHRVPDMRLDPARGLYRAPEIDARRDAHPAEHVDEVLCRDVAGCGRRKRAAPEPAEARVEDARARHDGGVGVGEARVARVVEMSTQGNARHGLGHPAEYLAYLARHADADRVGDRDLEWPGLRDLACDVDDALHRHLALERAAERGRDRDLRADSRGMRSRGDLAPGADRLRARDALVPPVELVGRKHDHPDLPAAGGGGAVEPRAIQDQPDVRDVVAIRQAPEDGLGVRHLRHAPRIHEARDLDAPDPGVDGAANELELHRGRNRGGLVLQAVARPDLDDADAARAGHCTGLYTQRAAAISRRGPRRVPARSTVSPSGSTRGWRRHASCRSLRRRR